MVDLYGRAHPREDGRGSALPRRRRLTASAAGDDPARAPALSVVVPLFQKGASVERALRSIAAQSFDDLEVIVVDDGSTDDGPRRVRSFRDPRVRMISQVNAGPGAARNRGIAAARGALVAFLDADDVWDPAYLATAVAALDATPAAAAFTCAHVDVPPGRSTAPYWRRFGIRPGLFRCDARTPVRLLVTIVQFMWTSATVVRASALARHGGFHERGARYGEDAVLMLSLALHEPLLFSLEALTTYHRGDSALNRRDRGARPIEPFLLDPSLVRAPGDLRPLLASYYGARALKTAAVLAYHGRPAEGRALARRFRTAGWWRHPFAPVATLATTPLGPLAGRLHRGLGRRRGLFDR